MARINLEVDGMTCMGCSNAISSFLEKEGADNITININNKLVSFEWEDGEVEEEILDGIEKMGYAVAGRSPAKPKPWYLKLQALLIVSAVLTLPMIINHFAHWLNGGKSFISPGAQLLLTLPVYAIGVYYFGISTWKAVRSKTSNMDVLIFLGSTAAFFYSLYGWFVGDMNMIFFETAASIITLVLFGNWIEKRALSVTDRELDDLSDLLPEFTTRIEGDKTREIALGDLQIGDKLLLRSGDRVPADGKVFEGSLHVNEAFVTGESEQVTKQTGDQILGGTIVKSGNGQMIVTKDVHDSFIEEVVNLIRKAQSEKPEIQRLADRISAWFVPLVLSIAALTFFLEYGFFDFTAKDAFINAIAVLVISCPCAMGLATPTALSVGLGRLTKMGIVVKGKNSIQKVAGADMVIFDKTGTLTSGDIQVGEWRATDESAKGVALALAQNSSHPVSNAVRKYIQHDNGETAVYDLVEVNESPGEGMMGKDQDGNSYYLGKDAHSKADAVLLKNDQRIADIQLEEHLAKGSREAVRKLIKAGLRVILLSGDREEKVARMAKQLDVSEYHAGVTPDQKYQLISELSHQGQTIMVGDGINDAPALQRAGVGISFNEATSIAKANADIIFTAGDRADLPILVDSSKKILQTIKQNLFWAFIYNVIAIPLAALGYLAPMVAALSMAFSDVVVIGNSLLLRAKIKK
ncbi:MAG TPA: cation-translocating P-type ATPase [Saprospiraceae bacterium]|nr:cation-translocating P-type ATPase [Saprospiraceae bacterium]